MSSATTVGTGIRGHISVLGGQGSLATTCLDLPKTGRSDANTASLRPDFSACLYQAWEKWEATLSKSSFLFI